MRIFLLSLASCLITSVAIADDSILVQSTTSTANSGLYDFLLPGFETSHSIRVKVVAVGTGQAIRNASNCDADVLLVHAKDAEEKFVADGFGVKRYNLMYNDFVVVGPENDPAEITQSPGITDALVKIAKTNALFASRGDNSGTHKKELNLWAQASIDTKPHNGKWYRETGSGMGATLNTAVGMNAYTLTDRATWISFKNRQTHKILFEGETELFNQYGVTLVSSKKCPSANAVAGQHFIDWLVSVDGQKRIADYQLNGQQLFYPNANSD